MELRIRDVSKTYPNGVQALKDVSELCTRMAILDRGEILLDWDEHEDDDNIEGVKIGNA